MALSTRYGAIKSISIVLILALLISFISADLPSCYRARCSHCNVQFIAKMCSSVCSSCDNFDAQNLQSGQKIRSGMLQKKVDSPTQPRVYGQPINVPYDGSQTLIQTGQRGPPYETYQAALQQQNRVAPYAHQLPEEKVASQQQSLQQIPLNTGNNNVYSGPTQNLQQPTGLTNQATGFGSFYTPYNNAQNVASNGQILTPQPQPQQPQYFQQFQPQQIQNSFNPFFNQQQGQLNVPQQPFGVPQTPQQNSLFVNPFQPFLQQPYQAQQQYAQAFTPAPVAVTPFPSFTMPPFPALPTITPPIPAAPQPQQFGYLQPQNSQPYPQQQQTFSSYSQPRVVGPVPVSPATPTNSQYAYRSPQSNVVPVVKNAQPRPNQIATQEYQQPERPKQIYNQGSITYSNNNQLVAQIPIKQQVPQIATNIDTSSIYVNKNAYEEKNKAYVTETCPKQPNWEPCISKEVANERFRNCCQRLGEGCTAICSYDQPLSTLQLAVLTGRCPVAKVADVMLCASGYEDATACCQAYGVFEVGFEHCRPYCNPAAGLPNDGMLSEKYRCLGKLSQIQRCFYVSQKP